MSDGQTSAAQSGGAGKIGLFGLIGMVVSSCIGSGAFALTGQIAQVAAPGPALIAWGIAGVGFLMLALSLKNLGEKRPDLDGIFSYATEGFGPFAGFLSGWGYWLSAWLGNVAFATATMSAVGMFYPTFASGNTVPCVVIASIFMWALTFLVIRGVESASFLNAIVMVAKVAALALFIVFGVVMFNAGVFTQDFWGQLYDNLVAMGQAGPDAVALGSVGQQVVNCLIIMMWCFIGIEGASVLSSRAQKKSDAGKATVIGLVALLVIYIGVSVLPFGFMPYTEIAQLNDTTSMAEVFNLMAPGWGGPFITIAMIVSIAGCWLSFTILPAETTQLMANHKLLPASFGQLNDKKSPQFSLLVVAACTQAFLIVVIFSESAYDFAFSMCTVAIVVTWALAAAYQMKYSLAHKQAGQAVIGLIALAFLVVGVLFNGWSFLLLTCIGYIPGLFAYVSARKTEGVRSFTPAEHVVEYVVIAGAVLAVILLATGIIVI